MDRVGTSDKDADVAALLAAALAAHQRGALAEAKQQYDVVLRQAPDHDEALYFAGALAVQLGQNERALDLLTRSLAFRPDDSFVLEAHGAAALNLGNAALAVESFEKAIAARESEDLRTNLGRACTTLARSRLQATESEDAERLCWRALELNPRDADAAYVLANALRLQDRMTDAAKVYARIIANDPSHAGALDEYGGVLFALGRLPEAEQAIRQSIALAPQNANAYTNLGRLYFPDPEKAAWALELHDKALALQPGLAGAHCNRGTALYLLGRYEEAIASHRKAIALKPSLADAHNNLGNDLFKLGDVDGAIACYREAIVQSPNYADAHLNKALALLTVGRYAEGWSAYDRRWKASPFAGQERKFARPRWNGRDTKGKVLVWGEQGVGDEILYGGMVADVAATGRDLVWEMDARLVPLIARSFPSVKAVARRTPADPATTAPDIAAQIAAASLGQTRRPDLASFPTMRMGYLQADGPRAEGYRRKLLAGVPDGERLVGLSWVSKNPDIGIHKTLPLAALAPVLKTPGVRFVDLQYGDTAVERATVARDLGVSVRHLDDLDLFNDIDGLAALIAACDLVVTVSNTTAHLAGALGKPVWVLASGGNGKLWYWGQNGDTTPWYPSARVFRQPTIGDWDAPVSAVATALADMTR
jgi:tetratricopeptide (TPR) repeat protein